MKFRFRRCPGRTPLKPRRQFRKHHITDIMPRLAIFRTGISEADDQFHGTDRQILFVSAFVFGFLAADNLRLVFTFGGFIFGNLDLRRATDNHRRRINCRRGTTGKF